MDRRTFLSRVVLSGAAATFPTLQAAQGASTAPCILLVDGVTPSTSSSDLFAYLDPIISQNVPVSIVVKFDREEWDKKDANTDLMRFFSTMTTDYPGLIDLALDLPDLASQHPYLRMRSASEARNRFTQSLSAALDNWSPKTIPQTIVSRLPNGERPIIEGLRSAGVLSTILLPETGMAPEIWRNSDGTQQINGGWRLPPSATSEDIAATLATATSSDGPIVLAAKFPSDSPQGEEGLFNQGAVLGDTIRRNLISNRNYLILPSELRFRSGDVFSRNLVLCIQADGSDAEADGLAAKLTAAGVPFSVIKGAFDLAPEKSDATSAAAGEDQSHKCFQVSTTSADPWKEARSFAFEALAADTKPRTIEPISCAAVNYETTPSSNMDEHAGFEIVLNMSPGKEHVLGYDERGALRMTTSVVLAGSNSILPAQTLRGRIDEVASPSEDVVLLIKATAYSASDDANELVKEIVALGKSDQFSLLNIKQYHASVSVKSEQARLLRFAQRWPARPYEDEVSSAERDILMDDAKSAWSYFEQLTNPDTGLVPATAWLEDDKVQSYNFSTMWDTGSLILAILSAHSIGLLSNAEFAERTGAVLGGLATGIFDGLRLPKGLASTNGKASGDDDYNASDTARLLVSLHLLQKYAQKDLGIEGILSSWDLVETIRDGTPLTVRGGRLVSSYRSNYAGYIARAFGLWGYPVVSPYSEPEPGSPFDRGVHILHDVAEFGPIGAEPHLLEAIELGASDLVIAASEALFAAQVEEYQATGKLVCVSEGPINREPWFVYQGFQIGEDRGHWTVETLDPSPRFKTKGFIRAVDMINSKGAFLWSAYRPSEYNDLLIGHIREKAMSSVLGFNPGVFSVTGETDQAYSDINTNAVILQSIAYRLNRGKPCVDWNAKW